MEPTIGPIPIRGAVPAWRIAAPADSSRLPGRPGRFGSERLWTLKGVEPKRRSIGTGTKDGLWAG
jgi:hypothetical protein